MAEEQRETVVALDERIAWLDGIVSHEKHRPNLRHPWTVQIEGEPWTVATDGMRMVTLRGDFGTEPENEQMPIFASIFASIAGEKRPMDLSAFREFVGSTIVVAPVDCPRCKNRGTIDCADCDGDGCSAEDCPHCGQDMEKDCNTCDGHGNIGCGCDHDLTTPDKQERVRIFGESFNRILFALPLRYLRGESATWQQAQRTRAALVDGGDWRLYVIPVRDEGLGDLPTFPALSPAKSAVETLSAP